MDIQESGTIPRELSAVDRYRGQTFDQTSARRWLIVAILFLVQVVNYADKTVVGLAAKPIMAELGLSPERYGLLASAFFSLYAVTGLGVAFLAAPRFRPGAILSVLLIVWSVSQLPIAFTSSFTMLIMCRVVLGMGEGAGAPTALNAAHEWFSPAERDLPSAVVMFGSIAGSLIAAPALSYVIALAGWRAAFLTCCGLGVAILVLWKMVERQGPHAARGALAGGVNPPGAKIEPSMPMRWIWRDSTVIGSLIVGFCAYWIVGFMIGWIAPFVGNLPGLDIVKVGWVLSAIYAGQAVMLLGGSYFSREALRRGYSSRIARGGTIGACMLGSAIAFILLAYQTNAIAQLVCMAFATGLPLVIFPLSAAMLSEIAPPEHRNRLVTLVLSGITLSAIFSPAVTGRFVALGVEGWHQAFYLHASVAAIGALVSFWLLRPEQSIANFKVRTRAQA